MRAMYRARVGKEEGEAALEWQNNAHRDYQAKEGHDQLHELAIEFRLLPVRVHEGVQSVCACVGVFMRVRLSARARAWAWAFGLFVVA